MRFYEDATHKIGRIITKDRVTSPLRPPFTESAAWDRGVATAFMSVAVSDLLQHAFAATKRLSQ